MIGEENPLNFLLDQIAETGHEPDWATVTSTSPLRVRKDHETNTLQVTPQTLVSGLQVGDRVLLAEWQGQPVILGRGGGADGTVAWGDVTGKPSTFPPSSHTHPWGQITDKPDGLIDSGRVVSINNSASRGYVRYADRRQEAWVRVTGDLGGTLWTNNIYYSDISMGNWAAPFARLDRWYATIGRIQYWAATGGQSTTSAGTVRAYRPNSGTGTDIVIIHGYGTW